jgi:hypothetical protein
MYATQRRNPIIGVRGAPTGPRSNLEQVDAGPAPHQLYVKVITSDDDSDKNSRKITLETLKYIHARLAMFGQMGVAVKVNKIRTQDLQNARLIEAMKGRGITRLPALTTSNNVYLGFNEIRDIYEKNIKEFESVNRRGERPVEGAAPDDEALDKYYADEMTFERAEEDAQETGMGDQDDMMDSYRRMMERREKSEAGRRPTRTGRPTSTTATPREEDRRAPPRPTSSRPDNVGTRRQQPQARPDDEDAEIRATIDRLARDIDDNTRTKAFSSGGGDSLDDDGGADPQDDLMERAYWSNKDSADL